jgi:hypothetical protein
MATDLAIYDSLQLARDAMAQVAAEAGIPHVDMQAIVGPEDDNFFDTIHLTRQGAGKIVEGFRPVIVQLAYPNAVP